MLPAKAMPAAAKGWRQPNRSVIRVEMLPILSEIPGWPRLDSASFSGPQAAVGNLRVSQTECPPGYATRITNMGKSP